MVVELNQGLDGLLHRAHLDQRHFVVLPAEGSSLGSEQTTETGHLQGDKGLRMDQTQERELILEDGCWKGAEVMLTTY